MVLGVVVPPSTYWPLLVGEVFGAGAVMDAFNFGFQVPNLFRRLFGEGALTASFLPVYAKLDRDQQETGRQFAGLMLALLKAAPALALPPATDATCVILATNDSESNFDGRKLAAGDLLPLKSAAAPAGARRRATTRR